MLLKFLIVCRISLHAIDIFCRHGADNFRKLFALISGLLGFKLWDALKVILKEFFKKS